LVVALTLRSTEAGPPPAVPLFENLGSLHHPITTASPLAQQYFDQGLRLVYGFNFEEAINAFEEAARQDPEAAMPYWGQALALGPNINAPMPPAQERRAYDLVQRAKTRLAKASPSERALVEALTSRYAAKIPSKRETLDRAYAAAMQAVARRFPDDPDAQVLAADALMNVQPWDYWMADGRPKGAAADIVSLLEGALAKAPDHPGACHFYIHAVEASLQPERAVPCAERLPDLMPGAGHLVHMPAHIFMRVGRYHEAAEQNEQAASVDHAYLEHRRLAGSYATDYYAHNLHFLWAALMMEGRSAEALRAARELVSKVPQADMKKAPLLQVYLPTPYLTLARFGQWSEVLTELPPPKELRYATGMWHFARGLAMAATGRLGSAQAEQSAIEEMVKSLRRAKSSESRILRTQLEIAARVIAGELAAKREKYDEAARLLREAVRLEESLPYQEPPYWHQPVRQVLGAILLTAKRASEAEAVYREDLRRHAENGWSLFGLAQSLRAQGQEAEARPIEEQFSTAWYASDVSLSASRF
jgi:tetratricopeptide (TPR) repeat protein